MKKRRARAIMSSYTKKCHASADAIQRTVDLTQAISARMAAIAAVKERLYALRYAIGQLEEKIFELNRKESDEKTSLACIESDLAELQRNLERAKALKLEIDADLDKLDVTEVRAAEERLAKPPASEPAPATAEASVNVSPLKIDMRKVMKRMRRV